MFSKARFGFSTRITANELWKNKFPALTLIKNGSEHWKGSVDGCSFVQSRVRVA